MIPRKVKGILRNSHSFPELNRLASMHLDRASIALASLPEGAHEGTDGDHEGGGARDHVADVSFSRLRPRDLGRIEEYDGANGADHPKRCYQIMDLICIVCNACIPSGQMLDLFSLHKAFFLSTLYVCRERERDIQLELDLPAGQHLPLLTDSHPVQ